jgi:hypothetical protein
MVGVRQAATSAVPTLGPRGRKDNSRFKQALCAQTRFGEGEIRGQRNEIRKKGKNEMKSIVFLFEIRKKKKKPKFEFPAVLCISYQSGNQSRAEQIPGGPRPTISLFHSFTAHHVRASPPPSIHPCSRPEKWRQSVPNLPRGPPPASNFPFP